MSQFRSTAQHADITWTDRQTGEQHTTTDCYVNPANGGSFDTHATALIAVAELGGIRDEERVQIDHVDRRN